MNEKKNINIEANKCEFIRLVKENVHREGAEALLDYLAGHSDFFTAPASTRFHASYEGGLCAHSLNVYQALRTLYAGMKDAYNLDYSDESLVLVALMHDLCKIGCYKASTRNVKDENGIWQKVPTYNFDDPMPYGHGEKSVYIVSGFMKLSREEAFAIRFHMGFSGTEPASNVGKAFEMYPLAFLLSTADMTATYLADDK